jgi:hypothetical protein
MFTPFDHEDLDLDDAIANAFADLKKFKSEDEGYQTTVDQLTKLYALRDQTAQLNLQAQTAAAAQQLAQDQSTWQEEQDDLPFWRRVEPNTVVTVAGNLVLGLLVIKYEQTGVISSKVMTFMKKI